MLGGEREKGHGVAGRPARLVKDLERRFSTLRRQSAGRLRRVPAELRLAVVAALSKGATATAIRRACGVSGSQLAQWRKEASSGARASRKRTQRAPGIVAPKVLEVVELPRPHHLHDGRPAGPCSETGGPPIELELQIGDLRLAVRVAAVTASQGGDPCCL